MVVKYFASPCASSGVLLLYRTYYFYTSNTTTLIYQHKIQVHTDTEQNS